jgi:16S rRNA processing protein RimM
MKRASTSAKRQDVRPLIEVGVVAKPHGVRGAIRVHLYDPSSTAIDRAGRVCLVLTDEERRAAVRVLGRTGEGLILGVEGVEGRDAAEKLRGARVLVERSAIEPLSEGQYLYADLIGCQVLDETGRTLGAVRELFSAGASDVLVVQQGAEERMIPFVEPWVLEVDLTARTIRVAGGDQWEPQQP